LEVGCLDKAYNFIAFGSIVAALIAITGMSVGLFMARPDFGIQHRMPIWLGGT
jgi:hypothetical protein